LRRSREGDQFRRSVDDCTRRFNRSGPVLKEIDMEDIRPYRDHDEEKEWNGRESENPMEWELGVDTDDDVPFHIPRD
ncbi:MAG TPA: hypothetical protein VF980_14195, partial [Thermoanaerobaculia bacterium]